MTPTDDSQLQRECEVFFRYLCGLDPGLYIRSKYAEAHRKVAAYTPAQGFDSLLVRFATAGPAFTRMADAYARFFAIRSTLRRKLILLLALLESTPLSAKFLDIADSGNKLILSFKLLGHSFWAGFNLVAGTILLLPCHAVMRRKRG